MVLYCAEQIDDDSKQWKYKCSVIKILLFSNSNDVVQTAEGAVVYNTRNTRDVTASRSKVEISFCDFVR